MLRYASIPPLNHALMLVQPTSVPVCVGLVRANHRDADVVSLVLGQFSQLCTKGWQVQPCHFLVEILGEQVHLVLVSLVILPVFQEIELREHLVGESFRSCRMTRSSALSVLAGSG